MNDTIFIRYEYLVYISCVHIYVYNILFTKSFSNDKIELKSKEEEELRELRAEFDIDSIPSISLQKIESKKIERKAAETSESIDDEFVKIRMRPPKNQFRKVENKLEVEYDLITVDPRNKLPRLNTLSENYRRNTVFGVVEERTMLLFHMEKFNPSPMQNIPK